MKMRPNYMLRIVSPLRSRSLLAFTLGTLWAVLLFGGCTFSDGKSTGTRHPNTARGEAALQLSKPEPKQGIALSDSPQLLVGDRTVFGSVKAIQGGQIKVEYADSLQPRYLPLSVAEAKGIQFHPGEKVMMVFNEQKVLVDFHPLGNQDVHHSILSGQIDQQMKVGQERVVVKPETGDTRKDQVRPLIRSKMAAVPIGVPVVFFIDETNHIVDVAFGDLAALEQIKGEYRHISNPKSPHTRVEGTVVELSVDRRITIRTTGGEQRGYPVRAYAATELSSVRVGDEITLLIDSDDQVLDIAYLNKKQGDIT